MKSASAGPSTTCCGLPAVSVLLQNPAVAPCSVQRNGTQQHVHEDREEGAWLPVKPRSRANRSWITDRSQTLLFAAEGATVAGTDVNAAGAAETVVLVRAAGGVMDSTHPLDLADERGSRSGSTRPPTATATSSSSSPSTHGRTWWPAAAASCSSAPPPV
jgi:hypothetical protein